MSGAEDIVTFEKRFTKVQVGAGDIIFREGDPVDAAYIVNSGEVLICTINNKHELTHLTTVHKGQVFGDLALINEGRRSATALTEKGCELIVVKPEQLAAILQHADPFVRFWIEYLGQRVIDLSKRVD